MGNEHAEKNIFKEQNSIVREVDIDGDGVNEMIAQTRLISDGIKIFIEKNGVYNPIFTEIKEPAGDDISLSRRFFLRLKNTNDNYIVLIANLWKTHEEEGYISGIIISIYKFNRNKLKHLKTTYSDYYPRIEKPAGYIANHENSIFELGREKILNAVEDINGQCIFVQTENKNFLLDKNLNLKNFYGKEPVNSRIYSIKKNDDKIKFISRKNSEKNLKNFKILDGDSETIVNVPLAGEGYVVDVRFGDSEDEFNYKYISNRKLHSETLKLISDKMKYEFINDYIIE